MNKARLEAFSDGVIAIIITIMVLELKAPHGDDWQALGSLFSKFLAYILSFLYVGIYWNNHHHLIKACRGVTGGIMWANLHLLFWLSLLPFVTAWAGEHPFTSVPGVCYGVVLLLSGLAYFLLQKLILAGHGNNSVLALAIGRDCKGWTSLLLYIAGIALSLWSPRLAALAYLAPALMWLVPDRRLERALSGTKSDRGLVE